MFAQSFFNRDISFWDVSNVADMSRMFWASKFDCDISEWNVSENTNVSEMFVGCPLKDIPEWYKKIDALGNEFVTDV
jgi:hypothetical protein